MAWVKRNLFFVVGGVVALALLGGAGFYIYKAWDRNATAFTSLNEVVGTLKGLTGQTPSPGNEKVNNTQIAKDQDKEVRAWNEKAFASFAPVPPILTGAVSGASFSSALQNTLGQLRREAEAAGVVLPPKYDFSFAAEKDRLTFSAGGLDVLAAQLAEVAAVSKVLFAARINALDSLQRVRVSDDDLAGPVGDYIDEHPTTNELSVITPYLLTFRCFTPELARVMGGFATGTNAFLIKAVNVQPAGAASALGAAPGMMPGGETPGYPPARFAGEGAATPYGYPPAMQQPQPGALPPGGKGGLQTVLKEQLLRVTMEVGLVKLLPTTPKN